MTKVKTRVYCCGGAGLNIGVNLQWHPDLVYIDTCDKNVSSSHDIDRVFLTEGTRGAGKNRAFIMPKVRHQIAPFLERYPAGDFNIVLFSMGGGSGSVLGPLIVSALAKAGETVIPVVVSGIESTEVLQNDIDTMKTLEGIAAATNTPINICPIENVNGVPYSEIDKDAVFAVHALIYLSNQKHERLDVLDLDHWARFTSKHSYIQPQLCELHIHTSRQEAASVPEMISVASLYTDASKEVAYGNPFVRTVGIASPDDEDALSEQLHFVINSVGIQERIKSLLDQKQEHHRQQVRYTQRAAIVDIDDNRSDDGFVL
ncbi:hypothetical protein [Pseudomonas phage PA1C]|uniref:Phage tubulin-like protein C-terminal domain-containing protein n=1 Tax=Pseudomonas phage vB_PaeM_PS119XW TaxID=2601632 RepID=A0A5C1K6Q7_9CAUD|nr:tubulin PhuZ [Pseudomonas phage vB_PaeM_PS119XW]QBX32179.1 hypothetical protein [Pseudomonas phage PA1C]QEM41757.1 hypothetical protein [Pseudomonas phage vB_PaeM_PS119XW]BEG72667.1 hypothetical protein RVBP21_2950 [Pseudomonas phage BRkr]